jgi:hypothetical protein
VRWEDPTARGPSHIRRRSPCRGHHEADSREWTQPARPQPHGSVLTHRTTRQRLDELYHEIVRIADLVRGGVGNADEEIRAFNARTGHDYVALDFAEYADRRDWADFALEAARAARPRIANSTTD